MNGVKYTILMYHFIGMFAGLCLGFGLGAMLMIEKKIEKYKNNCILKEREGEEINEKEE